MEPVNLTALVITLSDRASQGIYEDASGSSLESMLNIFFTSQDMKCSVTRKIIADDATQLKEHFIQAVTAKINFIFTTGGTGIGPRDITPDVIQPLLSREIPGIMELIRVKYGLMFPAAAISRSIAGIAGRSLVYCLPGNPKAVKEYMDEIFKTLLHCHQILHGENKHP